MTSTQLRLITPQPEWKLDAETKRIGFEGIAKARESLRRTASDKLATRRDDHDLAA
ncbi:MAG: hypothetical protein ACRBI6_12245 [Acidimicrobiales bacterium]